MYFDNNTFHISDISKNHVLRCKKMYEVKIRTNWQSRFALNMKLS